MHGPNMSCPLLLSVIPVDLADLTLMVQLVKSWTMPPTVLYANHIQHRQHVHDDTPMYSKVSGNYSTPMSRAGIDILSWSILTCHDAPSICQQVGLHKLLSGKNQAQQWAA